MCGSSRELTVGAFPHLQASQQNACEQAAQQILENQYVYNSHTHHTYHVRKGAGMGLILAGETADSCFWRFGEKSFAALSDVQQAHGILGYMRYRDDILIVARPKSSGRPSYLEFMIELKRRVAHIYEVKIESIGSHSVDFLDVSIYQHGPRLTWEPFLKLSSQKVGLSATSAHWRTIHESWPRAEICRLSNRSSSLQAFARARHQKLSWLARSGASSSAIEAASKVRYTSLPKIPPSVPPRTLQVFWAAHRYNPLLAQVLRSELQKIVATWQPTLARIGRPLDVRWSWTKPAPCILAEVRRVFRT